MGCRVLFIAPHLDGGGSERVLVNILNNIDSSVITPELLVYKKGGSLCGYLRKDVALVPVKSSRPRGSVFELARLLRRSDYDCIFVMKHYLALVVCMAVCLSGRHIPVVYREITHVSTELAKNFGRFSLSRLHNSRLIYRFIYGRADRIICPSREIEKELCGSFKAAPQKLRVIYNPVDLELLDRLKAQEPGHAWFREDIPVIISAGRLVKQKNYSLLIKAFKLVLDSGRKARLVILGKGELRSELEELAGQLGLGSCVSMPGHCANPFGYIAGSDIFVLASLWEGMPNALLEAMACGTAVISTDCPSGPAEIIADGRDGLLVPVGDAEALAAAILRLLEDSGYRERLAAAGRAKAAAVFGMEGIVSKYTELFLEYGKT